MHTCTNARFEDIDRALNYQKAIFHKNKTNHNTDGLAPAGINYEVSAKSIVYLFGEFCILPLHVTNIQHHL